MLETRRQLRAAKRAGGEFLDSFTAHQVTRNAGLTPDDLVREYHRLVPAAVRGRRLVPAPVRAIRMPEPQTVAGRTEHWTFGFLYDVILTRDTWMHRMDIARAVGATPTLTGQHDGAVVADVVEEWAGRHDRPFDLVLTGVAGGRWRRDGATEPLELDAVELCRTLSGRGAGAGLLAVEVPF